MPAPVLAGPVLLRGVRFFVAGAPVLSLRELTRPASALAGAGLAGDGKSAQRVEFPIGHRDGADKLLPGVGGAFYI